MALDSYAGLKQEVIAFSGRDDLSDRFDTFLTLAEEAMFNNMASPLRMRYMETVTPLATVGGTNSVDLPADFIDPIRLTISFGGNEVELVSRSVANIGDGSGGFPEYYAISGDTIIFDKTPAGVYTLTLTYYAKPVGLSSTNQVNDVLTNNPSIYLAGCLASVYEFTTEPELAANYWQKMYGAIKGARKADRKSKFNGSQAKVRGSII